MQEDSVKPRTNIKRNKDIAAHPGGIPRVKIHALDITVTPLTAKEAASLFADASGKRLLLNHNLHSAYLHETDERFRRLYQSADWTVIDGAPILWLASWYAKKRLPTSLRITSTDWIAALPSSVQASRRLFLYGATASSNAKAVDELQRNLPGWTIAGVNGYVDTEVAIEHLIQFKPDAVIVGLGMPRQEHFLVENIDRLPEAIYATVGGAIDYLAGATRLAPRWVGRIGMEFAWRLLNEPRRLAYRYLVEPALLLRQLIGRKLGF